jgi:hypothetical protein
MTTSLSHKFVGSLVHQKNANDLKDCTTNKLIQSEWNHIEDETPAIQNHILEKIKKRTTGNNVDKKKSQEILKEECLSSLDQIKKILLVNNKIDKNLKSKLIKEINLIKNTKKSNKKTKTLCDVEVDEITNFYNQISNHITIPDIIRCDKINETTHDFNVLGSEYLKYRIEFYNLLKSSPDHEDDRNIMKIELLKLLSSEIKYIEPSNTTMSKIDKMRHSLTQERIAGLFGEITRFISQVNIYGTVKPKETDSVEFRYLRLLIALIHTDDYLEWVMLTTRTLSHARLYNIHGVSIHATSDLETMLKYVQNKITFSFKKLAISSPTSFLDRYSLLQQEVVKLRPFQTNFIDFIKNTDGNYLILLKAMIGHGKTITSMAMAFCAASIADSQFATWSTTADISAITEHTTVHTVQMMYVCSYDAVRFDVSQFCHSQRCKFAIATWDPTSDKPKVTPSFICRKKIGTRHNMKYIKIVPVVICDPLSALYIMMNEPNNERIVFYDEPTGTADQIDSLHTKITVGSMTLAPKMVWSSATLPSNDELSPIINEWKTNFGTNLDGSPAQIKQITAMNTQIGCQLMSISRQKISPHSRCKTLKELTQIIHRIKTEPFVAKMYTISEVFLIRDKMEECGINNLFDIEEHLKNDPKNMSHTEMVNICIQLLEKLAETKSNIKINNVCHIIENRVNNNKIDINNLCTTNKKLFHKPTLVATRDTFTVTRVMLKSYVTTLNNNNIVKYEEKLADVLREITENTIKCNDEINKLKNNKNISSLDERKNMENKIKQSYIVKAEFLDNLHDPKFPFDIYDMCDLPDTEEWIILALLSGIGIYSESDLLTTNYKSKIKKLALNGSLRYIIADDSIMYGTNWPIANVICLDDMADAHSIASIMQLFGRAGRVGKSSTAYAYCSDKVIERLMIYIRGKLTNIDDKDNKDDINNIGISEEARNMRIAFNNFNMEKKQFYENYHKKEKEKLELQQRLALQKKINNIRDTKTINDTKNNQNNKYGKNNNWRGERRNFVKSHKINNRMTNRLNNRQLAEQNNAKQNNAKQNTTIVRSVSNTPIASSAYVVPIIPIVKLSSVSSEYDKMSNSVNDIKKNDILAECLENWEDWSDSASDNEPQLKDKTLECIPLQTDLKIKKSSISPNKPKNKKKKKNKKRK